MKINTILYPALFLGSVFISSISQILLKKSAGRVYDNKLKEYLNSRVSIAYFLFFGSTLITVFAYRGVDLSAGPLIESTGYLYVMLLSFLFLNERISRRKLLGNILIILGIALYSFL